MGRWTMMACGVAAGALLLAGCGFGSVGYTIPGTPISVGYSVPLDVLGKPGKSQKVTYLPLRVESMPAGAQVKLNDAVAGSTPQALQVPFEKGFWGGAKGTAMLLVEKPGYLAEGVRLFADDGKITTEPDGAPQRSLMLTLRK